MVVYVVSYRDESRPDLLELVAFKAEPKAQQLVKDLTAVYEDLFRRQLALGAEETNRIWHSFLGTKQIPENKFFVLSFNVYGNFALRISELTVLD